MICWPAEKDNSSSPWPKKLYTAWATTWSVSPVIQLSSSETTPVINTNSPIISSCETTTSVINTNSPTISSLLLWNNTSHQHQLPNHLLSPLVKQHQSSTPTPQPSPLSSCETTPVINTNSPTISSLLLWNNTSHQHQLPNHLLSPLVKQQSASVINTNSPIISSCETTPVINTNSPTISSLLLWNNTSHQYQLPNHLLSPLVKQHQSSTPTPQPSPLSSCETTPVINTNSPTISSLLLWNNTSHQHQLPNHLLSPLVKQQHQSSTPTPQSSPLSSCETTSVINTNSPTISSLLLWNNISHQHQLPNHLLSPLVKQQSASVINTNSPIISSLLLWNNSQHQSSTPTPQSSPLSSCETTVSISHQHQLPNHLLSPLVKQQSASVINTNSPIISSLLLWNNSQHQSSTPTPQSSPLSSCETTVSISHQHQLPNHLLSPLVKQQSTSVINTNCPVTQLSSCETTVSISHQYQLHHHPAHCFWNNSQHQSSIPTAPSPSSPLVKQQSASVINTNSTITQLTASETTVNISHQYQLPRHPALLLWNNSQHQSSIPTAPSPSSLLLKQQSTSVINTNSTVTQLSSCETTVNISHQYQLHCHPALFWDNSQYQSDYNINNIIYYNHHADYAAFYFSKGQNHLSSGLWEGRKLKSLLGGGFGREGQGCNPLKPFFFLTFWI